MKNREYKFIAKSIKKSMLTLAVVISAANITACSFNFSHSDDQVVENYTEELNNLGENIISSVYDQIDSTDFTSEESIEAVSNEIRESVSESTEDTDYEFEAATLIRVVDGDTIVVEIDSEEYKVRLIGINTPESVAPDSYRVSNSEEGVLASDYTKNLLSDVTTVYLEKDTSDTDKYDRLLRYVWLEIPEDKENINEIATKMLNGILIMDNVAEVATYEPDTHYQGAFEYIDDSF